MADFRIEKDSMGEVQVPADVLYAAQTQRAVDNFPISGIKFSRSFIKALGLVKYCAAATNADMGGLPADKAEAIMKAAQEVIDGKLDGQFPIDIYQTGSGTSTNMNTNEVIANRATQLMGGEFGSKLVHPNDHVNMGQSSNDVIPTAIHVAAAIEASEVLLPGLSHLSEVMKKRASELDGVTKTGRTHLMDAMPVRMSQEIGGWAYQMDQSVQRIKETLPRVCMLALGGTAVGTGINAIPGFAAGFAAKLAVLTGLPFAEASNHFAYQSSMDSATELSGQLATSATALLKIANDLRWMNSGPIAGIGEIALPNLQPGSSIMPGKVNPVICEATMMVCGQVIGNNASVQVGNLLGNFQLNVMLPLIAHNLLNSIDILGKVAVVLADKAIAGFTVNEARITDLVGKNPILVTALNPVIGYDKAAKLAKRAYAEGRSLKDVALEDTELTAEELDRLLDPRPMTEGGIVS